MNDKYWTDKYETGLIKEYEEIFKDLKDKPIKYLEIGIFKGGSLHWARKFFKNAKIFGIDNNIISLPIKDVAMFKLDQNDNKGLVEFGNEYGPFDIIIDDGSHNAALTENTFNCLYQFLKAGGKYIIEDWAAYLYHKKEEYKDLDTLVSQLILKHSGQLVAKRNTSPYAIINF